MGGKILRTRRERLSLLEMVANGQLLIPTLRKVTGWRVGFSSDLGLTPGSITLKLDLPGLRSARSARLTFACFIVAGAFDP